MLLRKGVRCWLPQVYYVYGFMLLVFAMLLVVAVCTTIVGTYFLLNAENYHWWVPCRACMPCQVPSGRP